MRWFCTAHMVQWDRPEYEGLKKKMGKAEIAGARAVIVHRVWKGEFRYTGRPWPS